MFKIGGQYNKAVEMYAAAKNYNKEQLQSSFRQNKKN
jgi:hypothetical protein